MKAIIFFDLDDFCVVDSLFQGNEDKNEFTSLISLLPHT
jgi:hypothetical protein